MSEYLRRVARIGENREQKAALDRARSCVVIAGPGSGKTYLLATKVAKLLFEQIPAPRGVACLTFSNLLMEQLKADLRQLGLLRTRGLFVGTVHSFCLNEIIRGYGHLFEGIVLPEPFRIASKAECTQAVREALRDQGIDYAAVVDVLQHGQRWIDLVGYLGKYRRRDPYCESTSFQDERWQSLSCSAVLSRVDWAALAKEYVTILLHNQTPAVDFTEIEIMALRMVEEHRLVQEMLEARYPWFAIDEYQDLGYPFHRMITTLVAETGIRVFAIGDPDQCIYEELLGTSPRFILELGQLVRTQDGAEPIELKRNYRCAPRLIEVSERLLGRPKDYQSSTEGGVCFCYPCRDFEEQQHLVLEVILPSLLRASDGPECHPGDIAILHPWRRGREGVNRIAEALDDLDDGPAFTLDKDLIYDTRKSKTVEWLEKAAQWCLQGWTSGQPYFRDLVPFWVRLSAAPDYMTVAANRLVLEQKLFSCLWGLRRSTPESEISFADWISSVREELSLDALISAYRTVAPDDADEFSRIVRDIETEGRLSEWPLARFAKGPNRIQLTTLHSSKGTQFAAVIVAGLDKLGFFSSELNEQHRRLAYVAVTRAKHRVYLLFEGMPEILGALRHSVPEGCCFHKRLGTVDGVTAWQRPLS